MAYAFDSSPSTVWESTPSGWLKFSYSPAARVRSYTVTGPTPDTWVVQGSYNRGSTWVTIDAQVTPIGAGAVFTKNITGWFSDVRFVCGQGLCRVGDLSVSADVTAATIPQGTPGLATYTQPEPFDGNAGTAASTPVNLTLSQPTTPLGYSVTVGTPLPGWTLYGLFTNGTWGVLDAVPVAGNASVSLGLSSKFATTPVIALSLACSGSCSVAELSLLGIPQTTQPAWISQPSYASGAYAGTTNTSGVLGEYLQKITAPTTPLNFTFATSTAGVPSGLALMASSDGVTYVALSSAPGPFQPSSTYSVNVTAGSTKYSQFRLVCTGVVTPDSSCWIASFDVQPSTAASSFSTGTTVLTVSSFASSGVAATDQNVFIQGTCVAA